MMRFLAYEGAIAQEGYEWETLTDEEWAEVDSDDYAGSVGEHYIFPWNPLKWQTPYMWLEPGYRRYATDYNPVALGEADSGLFRDFAHLVPTEEEIWRFTNTYGPLHHIVFFHDFEYEVRTMRFLLDLWEASEKGETRGIIDEHFFVNNAGVIEYPFRHTLLHYPPLHCTRDDSDSRPLQGQEYFTYYVGEPIEAARAYVSRAINERLSHGRYSISLESSETTYLQGVYPIPGLVAPDHTASLVVRPDNLISALWAQFAMAIADRKEFRQCETCGQSFELSPDLNRTSRLYCDDACRVKAYRKRKLEAKRLAKSGVTPREIAKKLDTDVATIKKWIARKGR